MIVNKLKADIVQLLPQWGKSLFQAILLLFLLRLVFFCELFIRLHIDFEKILMVISGFFYYDLLLLASVFVIIAIPYCIIQHIFPRFNGFLVQGLFVLYSLLTALLAEYYCEVFRPLDQVVFAYTPQELLDTVAASTNVSAVSILFLTLYVVVCYVTFRFRNALKPSLQIAGIFFLLSCIAFSLFRYKSIIRSEKGYVLHSDFFLAVNQVSYSYIKISDYVRNDGEKVSLASIRDATMWWWSQNNSKAYCDVQYPFLRKNTDEDVLGSFLNKTSNEEPPNIVIIIMEGFGRKLTVDSPQYSFTPFLDSLAHEGLFWPNCLSTTERTFGVLPAMLASVPQGAHGFANRRFPMAEHNSLLKDLKNNGYLASFFYGGSASFSGQKNFLRENDISYIMEVDIDESNKNFDLLSKEHRWGLDDMDMVDSAIVHKKSDKGIKPFLDIYLTLTTHEPFVFEEIAEYEKQVMEKCGTDTSREADIIRTHKNIYASFLYSDNALRRLFCYYKSREDFQNTIFVITGDHRMAQVNDGENSLRKYNVPLIIYSPLLKTAKQMEAVVSHYDITPSLSVYLAKNYHCNFPENTHYMGEPLDTTSRFVSRKKQDFMLNSRSVEEWIHDSLYLYNEELYLVRSNLDVQRYENEREKERMKDERAMFQSLSVYTVDNNYLKKP